MTRMAILILAALSLFLFSPKSSAQTVCTNSPIPSGYVITGMVSSSSCSTTKAYQLALPYQGIMVCANSPVPSPYTVTSISSLLYTECGSIRKYELKQATNDLLVCGNSPIPNPYVVTAIDPSMCVGGLHYYRIRQPDTFHDICAISPLPKPWLVTRINSSSVCNGQQSYSINQVSYSGFGMCYVTPTANVPNGWVITSSTTTYECAGGQMHYLYSAYGGIEICGYSPVPTGWYKAYQAPASGVCTPTNPRWVIYPN